MAPKFGTSGLRGLVSDLTPALIGDYTRAFLAVCPVGNGLFVARDLRESSPAMAEVVIATARAEGLTVTDCGAVPTPALALAAMQAGAAAIMVTGSHIPADRNGLKFYTPEGEISKTDEAAILAALGSAPCAGHGPRRYYGNAGGDWAARYRRAYGNAALEGMNIAVWAHSAVSWPFLALLLQSLGARVTVFGATGHFLPVDTEAVSAETRADLARFVRAMDAVVSTDGDGDRPLIADENGTLVPGDVLGQITAQHLGAQTVVTTVSANSGADLGGRFAKVIRTKMGSPHVIAAMQAAGGNVVGYEPNGGFLLGFDARGPRGVLPALMTRDSLLPIIALLVESRGLGSVAARVAAEPARFTETDRIENTPTAVTTALISRLGADQAALASFLAPIGAPLSVDRTDGLRVTLKGGDVVHLRPSGNAPECRVYAEAGSRDGAQTIIATVLDMLRRALA